MANNEPGMKKTGRPEGGDMLANVRLNSKKKIVVNPEFNMPLIQVKEVDNHEKNFRCCMCGKTYTIQKGNFLTSNNSVLWKGNNGYIPICKSCCETLAENLTVFYSGNEEHALKHMCAMFDWYYCDAASAMTKAQVRTDGSRVTLYPSKASTRQVSVRGTTFLDTIRDDVNTGFVEPEVDIRDDETIVEDEKDDFVVTRAMIRHWGRGYTAEQYRYLEEEYSDWCAKNVCNTKTQEELYRNISISQLNIRIAQASGNAKAVAEAMDSLQKLMNSANILPKQTADNVLADTQTFGTLLEKYEKTRPLPEPSPEWKDVDGIRKYMNTWYRGGLGKALRVRNENVELYNEAVKEMEKYSVHKPDNQNSADGMGAILFDQSDASSEDTVQEGGASNKKDGVT